MAPKRLYETKGQRAKRLPAGTWFVWPDVSPKQGKYYLPKVYLVLDDHRTLRSVFEDIGLWNLEGGTNSPQAAYDRADALVAHLNAIHASADAAFKYIVEQRKLSARAASSRLGKYLLG